MPVPGRNRAPGHRMREFAVHGSLQAEARRGSYGDPDFVRSSRRSRVTNR